MLLYTQGTANFVGRIILSSMEIWWCFMDKNFKLSKLNKWVCISEMKLHQTYNRNHGIVSRFKRNYNGIIL